MATRGKASAKQSTRQRRGRTANGRSRDAIAILKRDHRTVELLFKKYEKLGDRAFKSKRTVVERISRELSIHAAVEEQILYPTIERAVPRGKSKTDHALDEHQEVKETLAKLQKMKPEDDELDGLMMQLMSAVREHVKEEETDLFPKLRSSTERATLKRMGDLMQMAKKTAPTRPHPHAPARPPANIVTGVAAAMVDRVRDVGQRARRTVRASR